MRPAEDRDAHRGGTGPVPSLLLPVRPPGPAAPDGGATVDGRGWLAAAAHRDLVLAVVAASSFPGQGGLQRPLEPSEEVAAWVEEQRAAAAGTAGEADLEAVLVLGRWRSAVRRRREGAQRDDGPHPHLSIRVPGRPALRWLAAHRPGPLLDFTASRHEAGQGTHPGPGPGVDVVDDVVVAFQGTWPAEHGTPEHRAAAALHREYLRRAAEAGLDRPGRPLRDPRAEAHRWSAESDDEDAAPRWRDLGAYLYGRGATAVMGTARALAYRRAGIGAEEALALETGGSAPTDEQLRVLRALRG